MDNTKTFVVEAPEGPRPEPPPTVGKRGEEIVTKVPEVPSAIVAHDWLYSVVPSGPNFGIYLAGYCRNCQTAFTVALDKNFVTGMVKITNLEIPRYGCEYKRY
jgi:hypothetical protein